MADFPIHHVIAPFGDPNAEPGDVLGSSFTPATPGVQGHHGTGTRGFIAGQNPFGDQHVGVYGESDQYGVLGITKTATGIGVFGTSVGGAGTAVQGDASQGALAGKFNGDVVVTGKVSHGGNVDVAGTITVTGDILLRNRDVAEQFGAIGECAPGSVMVIGENGLLQPCTCDYDKRAIGIISGAGSLRPAITLGESESETPTVPIAMIGTAYCLVDADKAPVAVGDLLTSSSTPGHAMKALDHVKSFGAVIGKALGSLSQGRGLVPVVVALQ